MNTVADRILEADRMDTMNRTKEQMIVWNAQRRDELMRYLTITNQTELLKDFFGIESTRVLEQETSLVLPKIQPIYLPEHHDTGGMIMTELTKKELSLLLRAFFPESTKREYIIDLVFYKNAFLQKNLTDMLDVMQQTENLIGNCIATKKAVLHVVSNTESVSLPQAANDEKFTPLVDRIENLEPGYFHFLHEAYKLRLQYVESLFCQTVIALAEVQENKFWAVDPVNFPFVFPEKLKSHRDLIASICDFHATFDPHFPLLHTAIESTVAACILIYKGYSAPAQQVRHELHKIPSEKSKE